MTHRAILVLLALLALQLACEKNPTDSRRGPFGGPPTPILPAYYGYPAWHPDGIWIAASHGDSLDTTGDGQNNDYFGGIWLVHAETGVSHPLVRGFGYPAWNPDGTRLAMGAFGQIFAIEVSSLQPATADTSTIMQLTSEGANFYPDWSPDGRQIVYDSNVGRTSYDLWIMDEDGSNKHKIRVASDTLQPGSWRIPNWSPDGKWIVYEQSGTAIAIVDTAGANASVLADGSAARFSRDGSLIAYEYHPPGTHPSIWLINLYGVRLGKLIEGPARQPAWSPDGEQLVFLRHHLYDPIPGNGHLWIYDSFTSDIWPLTSGH